MDTALALHLPAELAGGARMTPDAALRPWTDEYSNLLQILR
jgi:hypothetical protein